MPTAVLRLLLVLTLCTCVRAPEVLGQRVLLFEQLTKSKSARVGEGDRLRFRLEGDNFWQEGYIRELRPDIQAIVINDRFIMLDEIEVIDLGGTLAGVAGIGLMTFGASWSVFALVGYNTDGDPSTQYSGLDATVTGVSVAAGFALWKLLGQRRFRPGKTRRLRIVDLNF